MWHWLSLDGARTNISTLVRRQLELIVINRILLRRLDEMIRGQTDSGNFPYRTLAQLEDFFSDLWIDVAEGGSRSSVTYQTLIAVASTNDLPPQLALTPELTSVIKYLAHYDFFEDSVSDYDAAIRELNSALARFGVQVVPGTSTETSELVTISGDDVASTHTDFGSNIQAIGDFFPARPKAFSLPTVDKQEPPLCSVIMPFAPDLDEVFAQVVRPTAESVGFTVLRADDIWRNEKVMDDIAEIILNASVVIADLSGQNANVFYELGIAHFAGKLVVPIVQNPNDVPFDIRSDRYLLYANTGPGRRKLEKDLRIRLETIYAQL